MKVLVAIANHGAGNREYLDRVLSAYQEMPIDIHLVILSNISKNLGTDVEIRVDVPSANPFSLPFAHRSLFAERLSDYDMFIYSEDDTLLEWHVLDRFIRSTPELKPNEIAGFMRTETGPDGQVYYCSSHSFFRWLPDTVCERCGNLWAQYSNDHWACTIATQDQLSKAVRCGNYCVAPYAGRYGMLETAATDLYTRCGFTKLVCIDDLDLFVVPHLPNKYIGKMGLPREEMQWQIEALHKVHAGELSKQSLYDPETKLPGARGSKFCREQPDEEITRLVGQNPAKILVWGSGDGVAEADLAARGHDVTVMPLDAVLGYCCQKRGLRVIAPEMEALATCNDQFDRVVVRDGLHLIDEPDHLLRQLRSLLGPKGQLIARVPHLNEAGLLRRRRRDPRYRMPWTRAHLGATPLTCRMLQRLCDDAGFSDVSVRGIPFSSRRSLDALTLGALRSRLSHFLYVVADR